MDAGVHLPLIDFGGEGFSYRRLADTVDAARACGFAAVSANDHFVFPVPWLDGPTALAAVAGRSGEMALVTTLALATLRGPVPLAKALSALDILSGGRVIAGLGPGSSEADYLAVGVPFEQRWQRFDEAVGLLRALLGPGTAPGGGSSPRAGGGAVAAAAAAPRDPAVARELGLPAGLRRVARLGDGWLASAYNTTPEAFTTARKLLGDELGASSAHPAISRMRWSRCGPGSPISALTRNGSWPGSSARWSGGTRRSFAGGSASARPASARNCCPGTPGRAASGSTSGRWATSGARSS